ncbi:hypothetical protein M407DRAFT_133341 [Tulasnella calospora MUT 4182]|uniref:DNA-directed RNA polymerase RBP11-like dimerisation domain-containing protein n=1 Tax=Tulasnella calospora MUT 4182 TaxID=1051891 RepID=A0A0C3MCD6_9AGAM|nr:hypothetical protein M407DRAFT_133341 [Tulasnella calospora MUT 4182]
MNAPNRFELYVLGDDEKSLEITDDTKIPNAATIKVVKQDHTMANMIRAQLLSNEHVLFAGYKVPHPLEPYFLLKVQTDGSVSPTQAFRTACQLLIAQLDSLQREFKREFDLQAINDVDSNQAMASRAGAYGDYGVGPRAGDYADF